MMTAGWLAGVSDGGWCFRFALKTGKAGSEKYYISDYITGMRLVYVHLPQHVSCEQCILQWTYTAGNNWGVCSNGDNIYFNNPKYFDTDLSIQVLAPWAVVHRYRTVLLRYQELRGDFIF